MVALVPTLLSQEDSPSKSSNAQNGSLVITTRQTTFYDFPLSLLRFVVEFPVQSDVIHSLRLASPRLLRDLLILRLSQTELLFIVVPFIIME